MVTVFTPTYNRADTLYRVYESLKKQTYKEFEWLIIDDGSKDETELLVAKWIEQNEFPIQYYKQKNMGKFWSLFKGAEKAKGEWFLIADSDDEFYPETIQNFLDEYEFIPEQQRNRICGVCGLCEWQDTKQIIGNRFPQDKIVTNAIMMEQCYKVKGEKWGILKTNILLKYKPTDIPKEVKFMGESWIWYQMALEYDNVYINKVFRSCYRPMNENNLSVTFRTERYPLGTYLTEKMIVKTVFGGGYWKYNVKGTIFHGIKLVYAAKRKGIRLNEMVKKTKCAEKVLILGCYVPGILIGVIRKKQFENQKI